MRWQHYFVRDEEGNLQAVVRQSSDLAHIGVPVAVVIEAPTLAEGGQGTRTLLQLVSWGVLSGNKLSGPDPRRVTASRIGRWSAK